VRFKTLDAPNVGHRGAGFVDKQNLAAQKERVKRSIGSVHKRVCILNDLFPTVPKNDIVFQNEHAVQTVRVGLRDDIPVRAVAAVAPAARVPLRSVVRHVFQQSHGGKPLLGLFEAVRAFQQVDADAAIREAAPQVLARSMLSVRGRPVREDGAPGGLGRGADGCNAHDGSRLAVVVEQINSKYY